MIKIRADSGQATFVTGSLAAGRQAGGGGHVRSRLRRREARSGTRRRRGAEPARLCAVSLSGSQSTNIRVAQLLTTSLTISGEGPCRLRLPDKAAQGTAHMRARARAHALCALDAQDTVPPDLAPHDQDECAAAPPPPVSSRPPLLRPLPACRRRPRPPGRDRAAAVALQAAAAAGTDYLRAWPTHHPVPTAAVSLHSGPGLAAFGLGRRFSGPCGPSR